MREKVVWNQTELSLSSSRPTLLCFCFSRLEVKIHSNDCMFMCPTLELCELWQVI